jgi:hypothetical protein
MPTPVLPVHLAQKRLEVFRATETGHPVMNALARHVQRLRHLVDGLTTRAFQYSKAPAILSYIVGMLKRFH